ncbi:MAG: hypothetical protein NC433_08910 [Clostridiales bacterium]|nr:hypothetical protein [Clostridiales bacterium]
MRKEITAADRTNNIWNKYEFVSEVKGKHFIMLWKLPKYLKRRLKWSLQRITRGFSEMDIWSMDTYLQTLIPDMLQYLKEHRMGSPSHLSRTDNPNDNSCHEEWDKILNQMIFLWRESYEYSCSRKNPYEEEYHKAWEEYMEKYEKKYKKKHVKVKCKDGIYYRNIVPWMSQIPEYQEIYEKHEKAESEIEQYREECKDKALDMMKEYFYCLWD